MGRTSLTTRAFGLVGEMGDERYEDGVGLTV